MPDRLQSGTYHADDANLSGSVVHNVNLSHVTIRNACLHEFSIAEASYDTMRIEGVLVTELLRVWREKGGENGCCRLCRKPGMLAKQRCIAAA